MGVIHCLLILLTSFLDPNHAAEPAAETNRVVTQIEITLTHNGQSVTTAYADNDQLESILTYLRMTDPMITTLLDPDSFRSDSYTFLIHFSDGSHTVYRQIYHDYLQKNSGPWQRISPKADLLFPAL